jgi:hypothetical protein
MAVISYTSGIDSTRRVPTIGRLVPVMLTYTDEGGVSRLVPAMADKYEGVPYTAAYATENEGIALVQVPNGESVYIDSNDYLRELKTPEDFEQVYSEYPSLREAFGVAA